MKRWLLPRRPKPVDDNTASSPSFETIPTGTAATSDEELLRKFVVERDDRAFAELVGRHGGMVLGVCRRVLGTAHDAEDAFQAVFLVLARKADTLRRGGSLPAWLHKTAFRTALRARAVRGRRREQASEDLDMIAAETFREIASEHDQSVVDEELNALPDRYRLPLFLCCVEGKPLDVAARQLGWSVGSVKGRLERGRQELRRRLLLRRVPFALGFVAVAALAPTANAATVVAPSLVAATVQAGMQYAVGRSALGYVSQNALHLAQGSWNIMSLTATKIVVGFVVAAGLAVAGAGRLPSPAVAGGTGHGGIVLDASFSGPSDGEFSTLLALADEPRREGAAREGDAPRREGAAREGDKPRTGARDGDAPRREGAARDGDAPRREGAPREGAAREGERRAADTDIRNQIEDFKPQTEREEALVKVILDLQRQIAQLRQAQTREGGRDAAVRREGDAARPTARREGDGDKPTVRREGDKPAAARGADAPKREGDAPRREGADAPKRDGDAPRREGADAPKREGDTPRRESDAPKRDGE